MEEAVRRKEEAAEADRVAAAEVGDRVRRELHAEVDRREVRLTAELEEKR